MRLERADISTGSGPVRFVQERIRVSREVRLPIAPERVPFKVSFDKERPVTEVFKLLHMTPLQDRQGEEVLGLGRIHVESS